MNEARAGELLTYNNTHPAVIDYVLTELYPDWVEQEPETTLTLLRSLGNQGAANDLIRTKVNALKLIHSSEGPWEDWEEFQWVTQAFNDNLPDFSNAYRPELAEILICLETINSLRKNKFSDEVTRWLTACCLDQGLVFVIPPLDFIQPLLDVVEYRCTKCGNVDLDEDNKRCDYCNAPESALIRQPKYLDWKEIRNEWSAIQNDPIDQIPFHESVKGVHLAKLAAAQILAGERREQKKRELAYVA